VQLNADAARARREAIIKDPVWRERYVNGDPALTAEMRALNLQISEETDGTKVDKILAGTAPLGRHEVIAHGELPTVDLMSAVDGLRKAGLPDEVIKGIGRHAGAASRGGNRQGAIDGRQDVDCGLPRRQPLTCRATPSRACGAHRARHRGTEIGATVSNDRWHYAVNLVNEETGEQRTVVVTLSDAQRDDLIRNNPHTGGPHGPVSKGYALGHARKQFPGFSPGELIEKVVLH
jgi:hypothetical protein